jgi:hypothetical protein
MLLAVRIAALDLELECEIVPALNTLLGLALVELKLAPEPTASAAATISPPNARSTLRGEAFHSALNLVMANLLYPESAWESRTGWVYVLSAESARTSQFFGKHT